MAVRVRAMTDDETREIKRLAQARTEPARTVQRAQIIWMAAQGHRQSVIARHLHISLPTVRVWLRRFNDRGLAGLVDEPRSGHPPTYTPEQVGEVIATSLTRPKALGLPFGSWTLDRLEVYLNEEKGIPIKRSRIGEILQTEGLRWRTQETWFGERVDPEFAEKRGPSKRSTRRRRQAVWS